MFGKKFKNETQLNFEKIEERLKVFNEVIGDSLKALVLRIDKQNLQISNLINENKKLHEDIEILTKITEGNLGEAENCEFLMLKTYRKAPVVFKDGKLLTNDKIKEGHIHWYADEDIINVEVDN